MTDYEKLKGIIDEIDVLMSKQVMSCDAPFQAWKIKAERFLIKRYGKDSLEHKKFTGTHFAPLMLTSGTTNDAIVRACRVGLSTTKAILSTYLEEMIDDEGQLSTKKTSAVALVYNKIFIVHGHDGELKQAVARIIEKQGIEAIILSEQANKGRTIIEKFEDYSDVGGAICLFTADDYGKAKKEIKRKKRARQNVVLETGYFMAKLGRDHVVILADNGIEMPSDLSGVVYTNTASWQSDLLKELNAIGYTVDLNKLL